MGKERKTEVVETRQQQQTTPQPTAEETELNKLLLERQRAAQPGMIGAQQQGLSLINALLTGQALPGYLGQLPGGISPEAMGAEATRLSAQNMAGFQNLGIADSGVAFRETAADIAGRVLMPAEQFNVQNLSQLLNIAVGGQAQVQQPIGVGAATLGQQLAGLRPITQTGTGTAMGTTTGMNPFLRSFQTSLGTTLGSPSFSAGPFGF